MSGSIIASKRRHPTKGMSKAAYRAYRKKHVKLWQASGLSKIDYATSIGISADAFYDWLRAFSTTTDSKPAAKQPQATLIPVRIQPEVQRGGSLRLSLSNGIVLEWPQAPQAAWLSELLRGLA